MREGFSKGIHPTLHASAYNSDKITGKFNYELSNGEFDYYPIQGFDFANFIIVPAIDSVLVYNQEFQINPLMLEKLQEARDHIQKLAINSFKGKEGQI